MLSIWWQILMYIFVVQNVSIANEFRKILILRLINK